MRNPLILLLLLSLFSCSNINTKQDLSKVYKKDLYMSEGKREGTGVLVLPKQDNYSIFVESDGKINLLTFRTCSREIIIKDPRQGLSRKKFTIKYAPNEVEKSGICQTEISALSIENENSYGFIDYEDAQATLPAVNVCGGVTESTGGVSICQERQGMIEKIKFNTVVVAAPTGCELDKREGLEFIYSVKNGICIVAFYEKKSPHRIHRLTILGHQDQLLSL